MGRGPSNFRQQDVARAIRAAKTAGLDIIRVEVDPKTARINLVVREGEDGKAETASERAWKDAPLPEMPTRRRRVK